LRYLASARLAHRLRHTERMATMPAPAPAPPAPGLGYHGAVSEFKRRLIEATLHQVSGNRTHAARALGLQRTYLLRLIRELGVAAPPPPARRRPLA
jgi:DNA-binding NtrC family response regulator